MIEVGVSDGRGGTNSAEFLLSVVTADVAPENNNPNLSAPLFDTQFVAGDMVMISLEGTFTDPDGDELEYVVTGLPTSLFVDHATNTITGTLTAADVGSFSISVNVFDGRGGNNFDEFFLNVLSDEADETNTPPQLVSPFADETVSVGESVVGNIGNQFSDPDGDLLIYTVGGLPPGLFFDPAANAILGTPEESDIGSYLIDISVSDGRGGTNSAEFLLSVVASDAVGDNSDPVLAMPLLDVQAEEGDVVDFSLEGTFSDPDGDSLDYVVSGLPPSLFVDENDSVVGTLTTADVGSFLIEVSVFDGKGGSSETSFVLDVISLDAMGDNTAPVLNVSLLDKQFEEGEMVSIPLAGVFSDPDGDILDYIVDGLPPTLFVDASNTIVGTLTAADIGSYLIDVSVSDGRGGSNQADFILDIIATNTGEANADPVLSVPLTDDTFEEGESVNIPLNGTFTDPDGDPLDYNASGLPPGIFIDIATNSITGIIANESVGSYLIEIVVADGRGGSNETDFVLDVIASGGMEGNSPPTLDLPIPNTQFTEGDNVSLLLDTRFSDPDGDPLSYTVSGLPPSLFFDDATNTISGVVGEIDVGNYTVDVQASDGRGGVASDEFFLEVLLDSEEPNTAPVVISPFADVSIEANTPVSELISDNFSDADGDVLTFAVSGLPSGLSYDPATQSIVGAPDVSAIGIHTIQVGASDGKGGSVIDEFELEVETPTNSLPTGSVFIDETTPTEGDVLTASHSLVDPDGVGTITFKWESSFDGVNWMLLNTGPTYTVVAGDVNDQIRVVVEYTDDLGNLESVNSAPTAVVMMIVNNPPTGGVFIDETTPVEGDVLTGYGW